MIFFSVVHLYLMVKAFDKKAIGDKTSRFCARKTVESKRLPKTRLRKISSTEKILTVTGNNILKRLSTRSNRDVHIKTVAEVNRFTWRKYVEINITLMACCYWKYVYFLATTKRMYYLRKMTAITSYHAKGLSAVARLYREHTAFIIIRMCLTLILTTLPYCRVPLRFYSLQLGVNKNTSYEYNMNTLRGRVGTHDAPLYGCVRAYWME